MEGGANVNRGVEQRRGGEMKRCQRRNGKNKGEKELIGDECFTLENSQFYSQLGAKQSLLQDD